MADEAFSIDPQDVAKARQMGASDDQIVDHLKEVFPKQKDNFEKAQQMGASATDILDHLAPSNTASDVAKSVGSQGLAGLADVPALAMRGMNAAGDWLQKKYVEWGLLKKEEAQKQQEQFNKDFGPGPNPIEQLPEQASNLHVPETSPGKIAGSASRFATFSLPFGGIGSMLPRAAAAGLAGAASEGAGEATAGTPLEPFARFGAALVSPGRLVNRLAGLERAAPTTAEMEQAAQGDLAAASRMNPGFRPNTSKLADSVENDVKSQGLRVSGDVKTAIDDLRASNGSAAALADARMALQRANSRAADVADDSLINNLRGFSAGTPFEQRMGDFLDQTNTARANQAAATQMAGVTPQSVSSPLASVARGAANILPGMHTAGVATVFGHPAALVSPVLRGILRSIAGTATQRAVGSTLERIAQGAPAGAGTGTQYSPQVLKALMAAQALRQANG
jgi:hypothetical protein